MPKYSLTKKQRKTEQEQGKQTEPPSSTCVHQHTNPKTLNHILNLWLTNWNRLAGDPQRRSGNLPAYFAKNRSYLWLARGPINNFLWLLLDLHNLAMNWDTLLCKPFIVVHLHVLHALYHSMEKKVSIAKVSQLPFF